MEVWLMAMEQVHQRAAPSLLLNQRFHAALTI
ncbi:TPA: DNA invertase [Escherichia coli]|nr:DNA invertase [Salmonella enterica]HAH4711721.1 DNA invertase [Escherichia coli]